MSSIAPIPPAAPVPPELVVRHDRRVDGLLDDAVLDVVAALHRCFAGRRTAVLDARLRMREAVVAGRAAELLAEDDDVRGGDWRIAPRVGGARREVELSGPATAEMARAVAGSEVDLFMADLEDQLRPVGGACSPPTARCSTPATRTGRRSSSGRGPGTPTSRRS